MVQTSPVGGHICRSMRKCKKWSAQNEVGPSAHTLSEVGRYLFPLGTSCRGKASKVVGASEEHHPAPRGGDAAKPAEEATGYLERHQLKQVMQALLQAVLKEKPVDPCQFMVQMLQNTLAAAAGKACRPTRPQSAGATVRPRPSEQAALAELELEPSCGDLLAAAPRLRRQPAGRARPFSAGRSRATPAFSTVPEHAPVLEGLPARPRSAGGASTGGGSAAPP
ncbi:unnamed protein product, partial [Prorocentrum cordatum]